MTIHNRQQPATTLSLSHWQIFWTLVALTTLSLFEFRLLQFINLDSLSHVIEIKQGIVAGEPLWTVLQSRLLGPYLSWAVDTYTGLSAAQTELALRLLLGGLKNLVLWIALYACWRNLTLSWLGTLAGITAFLCLQHHTYLYLWDYVDIIVFTLFCLGMLKQFGICYFSLLFLVALCNRESGLFVALGFAMSAFQANSWSALLRFKFRLTAPVRLVMGILGIAIGIATVISLRAWLGIDLADTAQPLSGDINYNHTAHLTVWRNIQDVFIHNLTQWSPNFNIAITLLMLGIPALIGYCGHKLPEQFPLIGTFTAIYAGLWAFATVNESRVFLILIPFVIFLSLAIQHHRRSIESPV